MSGCTAIVCPTGATGAVDVRGGAPATRETDLLRPEETVDVLHAVVLSGGSAYGLAASCGAAEELERRGIGLDVGVGVVPIVSSACLFDLACGDAHTRPGTAEGAHAVAQALDRNAQPLERGCVGAGTGCTVGKLAGPERAMKSGLGTGFVQVADLMVGAVAACNACGDVVEPSTGERIAGMRSAPDSLELANSEELLAQLAATMPLARTNTTISCIATNAKLTKAQATKVAQMAADAYAHTIRPTHTTNDGDTIFVMATGECEMPVDVVATLATRALEQALLDSVIQAKSAAGLPCAHDIWQIRA